MSNVINVSNLTIDYGNERGIFNFNFNIETEYLIQYLIKKRN